MSAPNTPRVYSFDFSIAVVIAGRKSLIVLPKLIERITKAVAAFPRCKGRDTEDAVGLAIV